MKVGNLWKKIRFVNCLDSQPDLTDMLIQNNIVINHWKADSHQNRKKPVHTDYATLIRDFYQVRFQTFINQNSVYMIVIYICIVWQERSSLNPSKMLRTRWFFISASLETNVFLICVSDSLLWCVHEFGKNKRRNLDQATMFCNSFCLRRHTRTSNKHLNRLTINQILGIFI